MPGTDPALTVPCPTCGAARNQPCRSRHAVPIHAARRRKLAGLENAATRIIRQGHL